MRNSPSPVLGAIVAAAAAAALLAAHPSANADTSSASAAPAASATPVAIAIKDFAFVPASVSIPVEGSVTWKNLDQASHTATDSGVFDSGNLDTGQSFTFTFKKAGTYHYVCSYHPSMVATIVVGAAATATPDSSGY